MSRVASYAYQDDPYFQGHPSVLRLKVDLVIIVKCEYTRLMSCMVSLPIGSAWRLAPRTNAWLLSSVNGLMASFSLEQQRQRQRREVPQQRLKRPTDLGEKKSDLMGAR